MAMCQEVKTLLEVLVKKKVLMMELKKYTDDQKLALEKAQPDYKALTNIMKNKQIRIDILNKLDGEVVADFEKAKAYLKNEPETYKAAIEDIKNLNEDIQKLGQDVRQQDNDNRQIIATKAGHVKSEVKSFRQHKTAMKKYQNSYNNQQKADSPHFFDSKK